MNRETHGELSRLERFRQRRDAIAERLREKDAGGHYVHSYKAIGAEFSITRERVRQIAKLYGLERRRKISPKAQGGPQ